MILKSNCQQRHKPTVLLTHSCMLFSATAVVFVVLAFTPLECVAFYLLKRTSIKLLLVVSGASSSWRRQTADSSLHSCGAQQQTPQQTPNDGLHKLQWLARA